MFSFNFDRKNEEGAKFIDESMSDIDAGQLCFIRNASGLIGSVLDIDVHVTFSHKHSKQTRSKKLVFMNHFISQGFPTRMVYLDYVSL